MNTISCDVTKDLLASYLDGLCSEESKALVEEHLKGCEECRHFKEMVLASEMSGKREKKQVETLQGLNLYLRREKAIVIFLVMLLPILVICCCDYQGQIFSTDKNFIYGILLLPLLLAYANIFRGGRERIGRSKKDSWLALASVLLFGYVEALLLFGIRVISTGNLYSIPAEKMGPLFAMHLCISLGIGGVLLVAHVLLFRRNRRYYPAAQNVVWCGIGMAFLYLRALYNMVDCEQSINGIIWINVGLILEIAAVTVILAVVRKIRRR